jgi:hypothetical protein
VRLGAPGAAGATDLFYAQGSAVLDRSHTLPQGNGGAGPTLAGGAMRGERNLIVLDAGDMLYDAFAVRRSPAQSCSASRFTAGVSAFFILSQSGRTGRQNPSASRLCLRGRGLQACGNTVSPFPFCSLNRIPGPTLANTISSVALHTGPGPPPELP